MSMFNDDAAGLKAFLASQTAIIERQANETTFPEILYPGLIPVSNAGNPFATSVLYLSNTQAGKAEWIHGDADDVPMADAGLDAVQTPVFTAGIGYGYGWEELNQARQVGVPLDSYKAVAARRAYEQMVDDVALNGDKKKGFTGLINAGFQNAGALSDWTQSPAIADSVIIGEFNSLLFKTGAGNVPTADTVLLPNDFYQELFNRYQTNGRDNLLTYLQQNNAYTAITGQPITIRALKSLETTGSGGNKHKAIAYRRAPDVLTLHIPMPHRFLPVYQAGPLRWEVPGVFRMGGLNVRRKQDTAYLVEA